MESLWRAARPPGLGKPVITGVVTLTPKELYSQQLALEL